MNTDTVKDLLFSDVALSSTAPSLLFFKGRKGFSRGVENENLLALALFLLPDWPCLEAAHLCVS